MFRLFYILGNCISKYIKTERSNEKLSEAQVQVLNQKYGLDQPIVVQFVNYVKNVVKGDFGVSYSISKNTDISKLLNTRLPVSFRIGGQAVVFGAIIGIMLGIAAALKSGTWIDSICTDRFRVRCQSSILCICTCNGIFSGIPGKYFPAFI